MPIKRNTLSSAVENEINSDLQSGDFIECLRVHLMYVVVREVQSPKNRKISQTVTIFPFETS